MPERARLADRVSVQKLFRSRTKQSVQSRMVVGVSVTGILLFIAIAVSVWQLSVYNEARRDWEETLNRQSLITNVRHDATILVLVTHRVAFTQEPFRYLHAENIFFPTDSIEVSLAALRVSRNNLEEEASRHGTDLLGARLNETVANLDELMAMAGMVADLGGQGAWASAQDVVTASANASQLSQFETVHVNLVSELRRAQILIQQDNVSAQQQMILAGRTSIIVSVVAVGGVMILSVILSVSTIRSITSPVGQLSEAAAKLAEGAFDTRVPVAREDELGQLANVFNYMAGELQRLYSGLEARVGTAEARLFQAIERSPDGIALYDADDRLVLCNDKYRDRPAEIANKIVPGLRFEDLITEAANAGYYITDPLTVSEWVDRRLARHRDPHGSFELQISSGNWLRISEYRTPEGGIFGIRTDITEMKRAERDLRLAKDAAEAQAEQLASLNRIAHTVVSLSELTPALQRVAFEVVELFDALDCRIALLNETRLELTVVADYSLRPASSGKVGDVFHLTERPQSALVVNSGTSRILPDALPSIAREAVKTGEEQAATSRMIVPLRTHGEVIGTIELATDQSNRKFTLDELELAETVAGQLASAIDNVRLFDARNEFLASISHELRTPLTAIYGLTKMTQRRLADRILPMVQVEDRRTERATMQVDSNFRIMLAEGQRLTNFINNVLDSASDNISLHLELVNISELIERASIGTSYLVEQKNLEFTMDIPDQLPDILGDKDKLIRVLINLISNAVKFTNKGSVTCRAEQVDAELVVSVVDTGIGIAAEDQPKLFKKFSRVAENHRGTGLGLSISKTIVELHGGRIWLQQSEEGIGSIFSFALPIAPDAVN